MLKKLLILALCIVLVVSVAIGIVYADDPVTPPDEQEDVGTENTYYTVEIGDAVLKVNTFNLNMEITKGNRTWYSGNRPVDEEGNYLDGMAYLGSRVTDGITVGYRNLNSNNKIVQAESITNLVSAPGEDSPVSKFDERDDGFDATLRLRSNAGTLSFKLQVRFDGTNLKATVPNSSIVEGGNMGLEQITLFPYFDGSYQQTEGQIFIPDGSGALIDLSVPTRARNGYNERVYGEDLSYVNTAQSNNQPERVTMPVLATLYPDGGTTMIATKGAEYCRVVANASGTNNMDYNRACFSFVYREEYFRVYDDKGTTSNYPSMSERSEFDAQITYTLMDEGVNIADVAEVYRKHLDLKQSSIQNVGLRLQFLMAENKPSMFGRTKVTMTTTDYLESVVRDVNSYCKGLTVSVTGYQRGGLGGSGASVFPMAGKSSFKSLGKTLTTLDVPLCFSVDYVRIHERASIAKGDLLQNISEQFVTLADTRAGSNVTYRVLKPSYSLDNLLSDADDLQDFYAGIEASNLGAMLFSGYKSEVFSRSDLIKSTCDAIGSLQVPIALSNPNDYMFGVLDSYVDAPIEYSAYLIETESVPFLQMVLGGSVPMYSEALNLDFTGQQLILRLIDSNVYPSFILTEQDAIELYGTDSQSIFTSSFDVWKYSISDTYKQVNDVLSQVVGEHIVNRTQVAANVYVNTYSNQVKTVVNYSSTPYTYQGKLIDAMTAEVVR